MWKNGLIILIITASTCIGAEQTWQLGADQQWSAVSESENQLMLDIAEVKKQVSTGQTDQARESFKALKEKHPQLAGADFDEFVNAELLYSERKYAKAAKAYDNFLTRYPNSSLYEAALERQYAIGTAFLMGHKRVFFKVIKLSAYEEGTELMNHIADKTGDAPIAQKSLSSLAYYRQQRGAYEQAYQAWADVSGRWPTGETGKNALYGMAYSLKKAYKGPYFDSTGLESSRSYYERFQARYSEEAEKKEVAQSINEIDAELAQKDFEIAKFYERTGKTEAAIIYYTDITEKWPELAVAKAANQKLKDITENKKTEKN